MKSMARQRKFKGFTLVELIVVMAIIVILAGIGSLGLTAFVRNARLETLDDKAQLVYTGFQNLVTQCEIKQEDALFRYAGSSADKKVVGSVVYFHISTKAPGAHGSVDYGMQRIGNEIRVMSIFDDGSFIGAGGTETYVKGSSSNTDYERMANAINSYIPNVADGTYSVYINFENYTVDSVVCRDLVNGQDPTIVEANIKTYQKAGETYRYCGLDSRQDRRTVLDTKGVAYGVYPYQNDVK